MTARIRELTDRIGFNFVDLTYEEIESFRQVFWMRCGHAEFQLGLVTEAVTPFTRRNAYIEELQLELLKLKADVATQELLVTSIRQKRLSDVSSPYPV